MIGKFFQFSYLIFFVLLIDGVSAQNYVIQKDHSQIFFKVNYLSYGHVQGQFKSFKGSLDLNDSGIIENLTVKIQSNSLDTGHIQRDGHLRANDFFYTQKYPEIIFTYRKTIKRSGQQYEIEGELQLRGQSRSQRVELNLGPLEKDSWGYPSRFGEFKAQLNRQDYGLSWNKTLSGLNFLVSDEVEVSGIIQLQLTDAQTPTSKHMIPDTPAMRMREKAKRGEAELVTTVTVASQETPAVLVPRSTRPQVNNSQQPAIKTKRPVNQDPWFWVLGLMGFLASIILGAFGKKIIMDYFPEYEEDSLKGYLSDLLTIGFSLIYAIAFWLVGWGD